MKHKSNLHKRFEALQAQTQAAIIDEHAGDNQGEAVVVADTSVPAEDTVVPATPEVATEDLDANVLATGPRAVVCIEPNTANVKAAASAYQELEERLGDDLDKEFEGTMESLRALRNDVTATNANGGFSALSAFFAGLAIEAHTNRLGENDATLTASFESAMQDGQNSTVIATDDLDVALEAVDHVWQTMGKRAAASFYRLLVPTWVQAKAAGHSLEALIKEANKVKQGKKVTISVPSKLIAEGDEPSKDLVKSFAKAAEVLKYLIAEFPKDAARDYKDNINLIWDTFEKQPEVADFPKSFDKIAQGWKDPRAKLGDKASLPLIGNWKLFEDQDLKYHGDNAAVKKLDALANHNYPTVIGFQKHEGDANSGARVDVEGLSPQEVVQIAQAFLTATKSFGAYRAFMETLSGATSAFAIAGPGAVLMGGPLTLVGLTAALAAWGTTLRIKHNNRSEPFGEYQHLKDDLRTLYDALHTSNRLRLHVGYDAGRVLVKIIHAFIKVAKLSLHTQAKAALESWDQATATDGVSVNETSPIEPTQVPAANAQAPEGEVVAKQPSFQDNPESKQDLNGVVQPATESSESPVEQFKPVDETINTDVVKEVEAATADTTQAVNDAALTAEEPAATEPTAAAPSDEHADGAPPAATEQGKPHTVASTESADSTPVEDFTSTPDATINTDVVQEVQAATAATDPVVTDPALVEPAPTGVVEPAAAEADKKADGTPVAAVEPAGQNTDQQVTDAKLTASAPGGVTEPAAAEADKQADNAAQIDPAVKSVGGDTQQTVDKGAALTASAESLKGPAIRVPYWFKRR
jgi:hypothetical protein